MAVYFDWLPVSIVEMRIGENTFINMHHYPPEKLEAMGIDISDAFVLGIRINENKTAQAIPAK
ncbi:MAG: hypothetical protein VR72_12490 [Clostridiaceae bacterium BRH_c20a]|nr:MAG: hypothetical protein VR72_12490 [Clostridiaceae bacterium BRH_c20a]